MLGMLTYHFHLLSEPVQPHVHFKESYKVIKFSVLYIILENSVHKEYKINAKTMQVKKILTGIMFGNDETSMIKH